REVAARLLASKALDAADQATLNRLLVDVMGLDGMIVQLSYDSSSHLPARHARDFRARMAMLIPQLVSLGDALQAIRRELPQPLPELAEYLQQVALWIDGSALQVSGRQLQERSRQLEVWL
ncbi:MAG TPA: FUSC family protein, partial [Pseudomonas sp.]|nr:FUSC family protein [Pseudomonas sp.]